MRHSEMGGGARWTCLGLAAGGTRTHDGLLTDSDTDWERTLDGLLTDFTRTSDGRAAVAGRPPYHGRAGDGRHWSDLDESSYSKMGGGVADKNIPPVSRAQLPCFHECRSGGNGRDVRCPSRAATDRTRAYNGQHTDKKRTGGGRGATALPRTGGRRSRGTRDPTTDDTRSNIYPFTATATRKVKRN